MCALHLDKPHHLHIHFVFWEKEPTYKTQKGTFGYRRKGKIDMTAINNLFVRIGLYIDSDRDKLYKTRVEAIRTLRGMTSVKAAMGSSDEIRKEILSLAKDLPKTGRLSYGSKDMEAYVGRVDKIVDMLIGYQGQARKANARFWSGSECPQILENTHFFARFNTFPSQNRVSQICLKIFDALLML